MIIIALLACLLGVIYTTVRIVTIAPMPAILSWVLGIVWVGSFALSLISSIYRNHLSMYITKYTYPFATNWIFYFLYILMSFLLIDLLRIIPALRPILAPSWTLASVLVFIIVAIFTYGSYRYHQKVRVPLDIQVSKPLSRPLKIVAISDLHLGYTIGKDELRKWVSIINEEKPDFVLIAGDIVDGDVRPVLAADLASTINQIQAPIYACLGNHEYIGGEAQQRAFLSQTKIQLLSDSVTLTPEGVYIIGRDDASNKNRQSLQMLTDKLDRRYPTILLNHQPYHLEEAEQAGIDLQISGHTHRGQVFPFNLVVDFMYEQAHGYHRRGNTQYYVSSGIGIWGGKYRIGTQSEYAVISLRGQEF